MYRNYYDLGLKIDPVGLIFNMSNGDTYEIMSIDYSSQLIKFYKNHIFLCAQFLCDFIIITRDYVLKSKEYNRKLKIKKIINKLKL